MHAVRDLSGGTLLTIITKFAVLLDSTEMLRTFSASALICHLFFDAGRLCKHSVLPLFLCKHELGSVITVYITLACIHCIVGTNSMWQ